MTFRTSDAGSAVVEFLVVGVTVLVPLVYLVQCAMTVHAATLASSQAVREAGRAFSTSADEVQARARGLVAGRLAFRDQGIELPTGALRMSCPEGPCLTPGSVVDVDLAWQVPLPWIPGGWASDARLAVPITSHQRVPVDDFRNSPR